MDQLARLVPSIPEWIAGFPCANHSLAPSEVNGMLTPAIGVRIRLLTGLRGTP